MNVDPHRMWLRLATGDVRTFQGWKDWYREHVYPLRRDRGNTKFSWAFGKWFETGQLEAVTVYLVHEP
jgi:hypothetical protein